MNIFLNDSISLEMIKQARLMVVEFLVEFQKLYGEKNMNYNVHLLWHLADTVENWGPLYSVNTFPFENENKFLLQMKHCNYKVSEQISYRLLFYQQIPFLINSSLISKNVKSFFENFNQNKLKNVTRFQDCILIGKGKNYVLSDAELECLPDIINNQTCRKFSKVIYSGYRYTTCNYLRNKRRNDSVMQTQNGNFGIITNICKIDFNEISKLLIFFKPIELMENCPINSLIKHIKLIDMEKDPKLQVIEYSKMFRPAMLSHVQKNEYYVLEIAKGALGQYSN